MESVECVVIGAGVVGLAVARALALSGRETLVLERANAIGTETSSRNSEVIHAGIHYPTGSLKARLCVAGKALLYRYCEGRGIPFRRCGKLIVATSEDELPRLNQIQSRAEACGVTDLQRLDGEQVRQLEPELASVGALLSPSTGIVDSHAFMLSLQGDLESADGLIAFRSPVISGSIHAGSVTLHIGDEPMTALRARQVVNCAGLGAQTLARCVAGRESAVPPLNLAKGNYFSLAGRPPFSRLVYPLPGPSGLGIHFTRDLAGRAKFGPDVEWVEDLDYRVDPARAAAFGEAIRRYWPGLPDGALAPDYAGIRPKLSGPGEPARDFEIALQPLAAPPRWIDLFGIDSPGLTAALALGDRVAARIMG